MAPQGRVTPHRRASMWSAPLLRLKYHDSIADALGDLGRAEEVGRKKADQVENRRTLVECLRKEISLPDNLAMRDHTADAPGCDRLCSCSGRLRDGPAMPPEDLDLAQREGWIWVKSSH
jgi:hypothetical protein